jgi:hypothetical protein
MGRFGGSFRLVGPIASLGFGERRVLGGRCADLGPRLRQGFVRFAGALAFATVGVNSERKS